MKTTIAIAATLLASAALAGVAAKPEEGVETAGESAISFDAGAALRIRQEIIHNVPSAPGGVLGRAGKIRSKTKNQMRFRPEVWMELKAGENWRLFARVNDEFRAGLVQKTHNQSFPGELVVDNLYIEGKGLFGDFLDIRAGRQDLYNLYGLNHIFSDGTPGDGSCSTHADMVNVALHADEDSWLDLFALMTHDQEELRWGTKRSRHVSKTGFGRGEREMDDWGFGAIWNSKAGMLDYKLFWIQKNTASFHRDGKKHPRKQTNLLGTKLEPHWTENFSTPVELMAQVGKNGDGNALHAWGAYGGFDWKDDAGKSVRPFVNGGVLFLSGDKHTATEDGGRGAWDPMWYRGVDDSEMFVYGSSLYGVNWWSNMINIKTTAGLIFGPRHKVQLMIGPMFTQERDGIGGGNGFYKGLLTQARYDFPIILADKDSGRRFEMFGHVMAEFFNPGDYFATDKPAYFVRWQLELRF